ncbi:MAG: hypothetical protein V4459_03535 [Pseudomonadota bacterium]
MKLILTLAAIAATTIAVQAQARPDTPANVAECVVDNAARNVKALLNTVPGSPEERAAAKPVLDYYAGCNDNTEVLGAFAWRERAELANAALVRRLSRGKPDLSGVSNASWTLTLDSKFVAGTDYDPKASGLRQLGDCVVRTSPQAAYDLASSGVGSAQESAAISALAPTLAPCVPAGQNFRVKKADLRLLVAEPLYHLLTR